RTRHGWAIGAQEDGTSPVEPFDRAPQCINASALDGPALGDHMAQPRAPAEGRDRVPGIRQGRRVDALLSGSDQGPRARKDRVTPRTQVLNGGVYFHVWSDSHAFEGAAIGRIHALRAQAEAHPISEVPPIGLSGASR